MREEFLSQRKFIAAQFKDVEIKVDGRFNEVDGRFNEIERQFQEAERQTHIQFKEVEKQFDKKIDGVDKKIDGVDKKLSDRLNHIQNASRNFLRTRGWEEISPVGSPDVRGATQIPDHFPRNIRHFWNLKDPKLSKSSAIVYR